VPVTVVVVEVGSVNVCADPLLEMLRLAKVLAPVMMMAPVPPAVAWRVL
jgi:hypothetical protein